MCCAFQVGLGLCYFFHVSFQLSKMNALFGGLFSPTYIMKMFKRTEKLTDCTENTPIPIHLDATRYFPCFIYPSIHSSFHPFCLFWYVSKLQTLVHFTLKYFSMHIIN